MKIYKLMPSWLYSNLSRKKAQVLYRLNSLKEERKGVFIHSMFRSGSTYLFKKFREDSKFWCYYEPLHHQLYQLRGDKLDVFRYDKSRTRMMNHPDLDQPHFYEYKEAIQRNKLRKFSAIISYDDFTNIKHHALTYKYLDHLLRSAPNGRCPLLQFNRSSLRIRWMKSYFKNSLHVYLVRSPRDQFESYYRAGKHANNIFLAMNIYILGRNYDYGKFRNVYEKFDCFYNYTNNIFRDLAEISKIVDDISLQLHYEVFLHLWFSSLIHGRRYADFVVEMDRLQKEGDYTKSIIKKITEFIPVKEDIFADANLKRYDQYSLNTMEFEKTENSIQALYVDQISQIDRKICSKFF